MIQVHTLNDKEIQELTDGYKNGTKHHYRIRCKSILLSNEGLSVAEIAKDLNKKKDTIYTWLNWYESSGFLGLHNQEGQGRKAPLDSITKEQVDQVKKAVKLDPQNLNKVSASLSKLFGFAITKHMLIRFLKKN